MAETNQLIKPVGFIVGTLIVFSIVWLAVISPLWKVWAQELNGKAQLAEATYNRQIVVQEAEAKKESAKSLAEAEIIRAGGIAKANEIIGQSLNDNEAYLRYLWIDSISHQPNQIIYVPTESNLPLLEAGRLN